MKRLYLLIFIISGTNCINAQQKTFENAHQAVRNMSIGWNLGNTLESCNYSQDSLIEKTTDCSVKDFLSRGIPLVIGEYAALFVDGTYAQEGPVTEGDQEEGAKYARLMVEEATKRDISLLYFMGLIDKED